MAPADGGNFGKQSEEGRDQALSWLAEYGDDLMVYARRRVASRGDAEDLVQETFLAAVRSYGGFRRESSAKTWLLGILRRKIVDYYRARAKRKRDLGWDDESAEPPFNKHGNWSQTALSWSPDPKDSLDRLEFRDVFQACLQKLNPTLAQAFVLRTMDQLKVSEVCSLLDISPTNLSVRMHRARVAMRDCLEKNWFSDQR